MGHRYERATSGGSSSPLTLPITTALSFTLSPESVLCIILSHTRGSRPHLVICLKRSRSKELMLMSGRYISWIFSKLRYLSSSTLLVVTPSETPRVASFCIASLESCRMRGSSLMIHILLTPGCSTNISEIPEISSLFISLEEGLLVKGPLGIQYKQ